MSIFTQDKDYKIAYRISQKDERVLRSFCELYLDKLYDFVYYRVGCNHHDTEEVVQETMLKALENIASFKKRSSLYTWICGIAKNVIRDFNRKKQHRSRLEASLSQLDQKIELILDSIESGNWPDELLMEKETKDAVGAAMSSLPLSYQEALKEKYIDNLSVKDIAQKNGYSFKKVESLLTRARVAFKETFRLICQEMTAKDGG